MITRMGPFCSVAAAALVAVMPWTMAHAQDLKITLTPNDGTPPVTGALIAYEKGVFLLDSETEGMIKVESTAVTCVGAACPEKYVVETPSQRPVATVSKRFGIHGSRTVGTTLVPNLLRGYAKHVGAAFKIEETEDKAARVVRLINADGSLRAEIDLQTRGSGSAFTSLANDAAEIGLADRRMKDSDLTKKLAPAGVPELRGTENEIVLGVDGIVLITHPQNPVPNLTAEEVARIWSGEITNWQQLGGGNYPITINSFGEGSGDRAVLLDGLVRPNGRDEKEDVVRWKAYQDMVDAVMADRGGIGFVGRWLARTNDVNLLAIREDCGLLSPPTDFRMKIEGYSLSRRLYAYKRPGDLHPEARAFLDWALTDEAQPYIKASNFIDRDLERMRLEDMGMMLIHTAAVEPDFNGPQYAQMMRNLRQADRLSISFRFDFGSSTLDTESVRNLRELAERMEAGEFDGQEVMLVGFADSIGDQRNNTQLAMRRAEAVRDILRGAVSAGTEERLRLVPLSYGELLPLSCNTTDVGRARNRRVEVWLKVPDGRRVAAN
ncbi:MAG: phosphate ABC transporter substrate-binding/OmpA family protein [Pseudomonadota bacterium]